LAAAIGKKAMLHGMAFLLKPIPGIVIVCNLMSICSLQTRGLKDV
jgi:hypothetical protein